MEWLESLISPYGLVLLFSALTFLSRRRLIRWIGTFVLLPVALFAAWQWIVALPDIITTMAKALSSAAGQQTVEGLKSAGNTIGGMLGTTPFQPQPVPHVDYLHMVVTRDAQACFILLIALLIRILLEWLREIHSRKIWSYLWEPKS